eukprot:TRINITY_DN9080_c0_g1_i1.p1 TRINITY_DN9080_c0_g1~~TRINITY_DN9080_c0_g1_i1.p1  ORF type:complete len:253 (-),score=45.45 TRINITY_DN9080_c0_g1_i1:177-935(-)
MSSVSFRLCLFIVFVCRFAVAWESNEDFEHVTCGSAVKIKHKSSGFYVHSHNINWGSGSGQQSVTAFEGVDDANNLWQVREPFGQPLCAQGTPIKCGDIVRLIHVQTRCHLHSHLHQSPLSHRQEISCYGKYMQASDTGDNWKIDCGGSNSLYWRRSDPVTFFHVDTGTKLFTSRLDQFTQSNCQNCPIIGQLEISAFSGASSADNFLWLADDGVYFPNIKAEKKERFSSSSSEGTASDHDESEHEHVHDDV